MKPGDLVRVNSRSIAQLAGKIGVVVEETPPPCAGPRAYKALVAGRIYHFYQESLESLEPVDEAR